MRPELLQAPAKGSARAGWRPGRAGARTAGRRARGRRVRGESSRPPARPTRRGAAGRREGGSRPPAALGTPRPGASAGARGGPRAGGAPEWQPAGARARNRPAPDAPDGPDGRPLTWRGERGGRRARAGARCRWRRRRLGCCATVAAPTSSSPARPPEAAPAPLPRVSQVSSAGGARSARPPVRLRAGSAPPTYLRPQVRAGRGARGGVPLSAGRRRPSGCPDSRPERGRRSARGGTRSGRREPDPAAHARRAEVGCGAPRPPRWRRSCRRAWPAAGLAASSPVGRRASSLCSLDFIT